jgi:hypothetical protein
VTQVGRDAGGGVSAYLVRVGAEGLAVTREEEKLG